MLKIGKTKLTGAHKDEKASKTLEYFPELLEPDRIQESFINVRFIPVFTLC